MLFSIILILIILAIGYDAYNTFVNKSYSRILHYGKKYITRFYIYYIKRHKIIMLDIDDTEVRDYNTIETSLLVQKINDIIRRETKGIVDKIHTYKSRNGRHIIIYLHNEISTREVLLILDYANVDEKYKQIFLIRGYFTLFQVRRGNPNSKNLLRYENKNGEMQLQQKRSVYL